MQKVKFYLLTISLFFVGLNCTAAEQVPTIQPQEVSFEVCNKMFALDAQKLYYVTLASLNANRFVIDEMQSTGGYILFTANKKQFLANVITIDPKNALLKITPCDNSYTFPPAIVLNIYKYIELNLKTPVERLAS